MIGALAVNPDSPLSEPLLSAVDDYCLEPYAGDTARLAYQMQSAPAIVTAMNANAERLADFLRRHPAIKRVLLPLISQPMHPYPSGQKHVVR